MTFRPTTPADHLRMAKDQISCGGTPDYAIAHALIAIAEHAIGADVTINIQEDHTR